MMRFVLDAVKKSRGIEQAWGDLECFLREGKDALKARREGREREKIESSFGEGVPDDVKGELVERRLKEKRKDTDKRRRKEKRKRSLEGEDRGQIKQEGQQPVAKKVKKEEGA